MESFGIWTPPKLENRDDFVRSLQLCPANLLELVRNGLMRYVDDIRWAGSKNGLDVDQVFDLCGPYMQRAADVGNFVLKLGAEEKAQVASDVSRRQVAEGACKAESRDSMDGESSRGGRRDSSGGGAPVASSTFESSELKAASSVKNAEFLGRPRKKRLNRKKVKFVKSGTKVVVRRWSDGEEFGPFDVETAGQYFLRVRNPVTGQRGRVCRKRYGTFDWRPSRASRSVDLESGEGCRSQWSSSSPRSGAWSCPSRWCGSGRNAPIRPYSCRSVCDARFDPGPWFGPIIGRCCTPNRHTPRFCRSS